MFNGGGVLAVWPLGGIVWLAAVGLVFQEGTPDGRILEIVIVGLITLIGILFRYGYRDVTRQLEGLHESNKEMRDRMAVVETRLDMAGEE